MSSHAEPQHRTKLASEGSERAYAGEARFPSATDRTMGDTSSPSSWDSSVPNPFSFALAAPKSTASSKFWRGIKTLIATLVVTACLLAAVFFGKQWLLHRLVADLDQLDPAAKQSRLIQIASFGNESIEPLTQRLVDPADEVSESAFVLLQKMQNDWTTLDTKSALSAHDRMVRAIYHTYKSSGKSSNRTEPERWTQKQIARGRELVRQTLLEYAGTKQSDGATNSRTNALVSNAQKLLDQMQAIGDAGYTPKIVAAANSNSSVRLSSAKPLNGRLQNRSGWTDWPPTAKDAPPVQIVRSGSKKPSQVTEGSANASNQLRTVPQGITIPLSQVASRPKSPRIVSNLAFPGVAIPEHAAKQRIVAARRPTENRIQQISHLSDSPMAVLDDETVIRHLANPDAMIATQARTELINRGFSNPQLEMATAISTATGKDRIQLIDSLVHSSQLKAGPWLSMLLDDPDRRVRLHVASTLASSLASNRDPAILDRLRLRLAREDDAHVATRLRRILDLR